MFRGPTRNCYGETAIADQIQFAALPYVIDDGCVKICLITSRETGRWITPKGWPQKSLAPRELAALEAFEEAGLRGKIGKKPVGSYRYLKRLGNGADVDCTVEVFPLTVTHQEADWPEKGQRKVLWVGKKKAAKLVDNEELAEIILGFDVKCGKAKQSKKG